MRENAKPENSVSPEGDLEVGICPRPEHRNSRHPIFAVDRLPRVFVLVCGEDTCGCGEFGSRHPSTDRAGCELYLGIVANAFGLAHRATGHHVEFAVVFSEPNGGGNSHTVFSKCCQRDIFLSLNRGRDLAWHNDIVGGRNRGIL